MNCQLNLLTPHRYVDIQDGQRCFFIGDIHGHWQALENALQRVSFDSKKDVLVSVGDTIDRHEDSLKVATWMLEQDNVHVVCGNHEKYFLDYLHRPETGFYYTNQRTGGWWVEQHEENTLLKLAKQMQDKLSLAVTVQQNHKRVGVIHSAAPDDWYVIENNLLSSEDWMDYIDNRAQFRQAKRAGMPPISNIHGVVHGHVNSAFFSSGNQYWIDTLNATGEFTLLEMENIIKPVSGSERLLPV